MTLRRRKELVLLARKHDALIICDDVYDLLQWKMGNGHDVGDPRDWMIPRLVDIDLGLGPTERERGGKHFGHAISNGSLSKLLGPGVRTGWVEGSPAFAHGLSQTAATVSGGAPSQLTATIVWEVLQTGALQRHVDSVLRPALQRRHALMMRLIDSELGRFGVELVKMQQAGVEGSGDGLTGVYGGYFVWIRFPQLPTPSSTTRRLAEWARESEDLIIAAGDLFEVKGDEATAPFPDTVRLCFSWEDEASIEEGMKRLGRAVESFAAREAANSTGENGK